jgi:hypothetical protein
MRCTGNDKDTCGGPNRLSLYSTGAMGPGTNPGVNGFDSIGCYLDSITNRMLSQWIGVAGGYSAMTISLCTSSCQAGGYSYAGVEYGGGSMSALDYEKRTNWMQSAGAILR